MDNMTLYEATRQPPATALKRIPGGRLKGMTDINPMWRIRVLTEQFGPCGIGWYYEITRQWMEDGSDNQISCFVNIDLFVKVGGEWSKPIVGTGGSEFVTKERGGLYTSDECYKMALTDAISVACKALGIGANIYWEADRTKYSGQPSKDTPAKSEPKQRDMQTVVDKVLEKSKDTISTAQAKRLFAIAGNADIVRSVISEYGLTSTADVLQSDYEVIASKVSIIAGEVKGK